MTQREAERISASRFIASTTSAEKQALHDALQIGYESANAGLKNISYHFAESVLTEMAHRGALGEILDRNIKR